MSTAENGHHAATLDKSAAAEAVNWMDQLYPNTPLAKFLFKSPLTLWRMGLGRVMGQVMLVLTATGRKSGLPRRAMVEWHAVDGKPVIVSAYGEKAQWCQNILADPLVTIQTADLTQSSRARRITDEVELRRVYQVFLQRNQLMTEAYLEMKGIDPDDPDDLIAKLDRVIFFTFDPTDEPTPPPLVADLTWIWGVMVVSAVVGGVMSWLLSRKRD